ncbi:Uroporphyrinogen decarboxylase superfamily [Verrucomicrobiia bacterium DG1235]|nr:Uroporphyrinogen decarboxylase superfamily [Verrucomicrobiae bacterium DG1235]
MTGKEILLRALKCEATPRVPWVPFVGVHGGALIGVDAKDYLESTEHIVSGLKASAKRYRPDGLPVVFDLQLEAEVLGCQLAWAQETPPAVISHPLDAGYAIKALPTLSVEKGRLPLALQAIRETKKELGEEIALYGLLTGPLTLALHLRGDDVLLDMFDEEEGVVALLDYCAEIANQMVDAYLDAGIDVIAVVDPMISQIGPSHFTDWVAPRLDEVFSYVRKKGALSSLFVCGNATRNLAAMCATQCDNISVDENVDLAELAKVARAAGKSFGGNLQLTKILLLGDEADAKREVVRCLDQAGDGGGFILAPGCDLPYAVKPENLEAVAALVHDPYLIEVARNLPPKDSTDTFDDIPIPDYAAENQVLVDIVTLDSAGCAPCAYMLKAAQKAADEYGGTIDVREHKITTRDGLAYMAKLGVTAIPSICVDGRERFASIIPQRKELVACYQTAAAAK